MKILKVIIVVLGMSVILFVVVPVIIDDVAHERCVDNAKSAIVSFNKTQYGAEQVSDLEPKLKAVATQCDVEYPRNAYKKFSDSFVDGYPPPTSFGFGDADGPSVKRAADFISFSEELAEWLNTLPQ